MKSLPSSGRFILATLRNVKRSGLAINAVEDHAHLLFSLHPSTCLADLVKTLKVSSHHWIRDRRNYPEFSGWQEGYGAFSLANRDRERVVRYIQNQQDHHRAMDSLSEFKEMLIQAGLEWDDRHLV